MNHKFKVGDRIRCTSDCYNGLFEGVEGEILDIDEKRKYSIYKTSIPPLHSPHAENTYTYWPEDTLEHAKREAREDLLNIAYRAHLKFVMPDAVVDGRTIPASRTDLREYYGAIVDAVMGAAKQQENEVIKAIKELVNG